MLFRSHHALINVIGPRFEKTFIYDSCANQKNKGTLLAIQRFHKFQRKVTHNFNHPAFCLKADVKQYFREVDHEILMSIIKKKIKDLDVSWLIEQILANNTIYNHGAGGGANARKACLLATSHLNSLPMFT